MAPPGEIDVLVANLAAPSDAAYAVKVSDERWNRLFDVMVHPLHRLVRAALPDMMARPPARSSWWAAPPA